MPAVWPMPSGAYDQAAGTAVYQGMVERITLVEKLGFDWVSLSEHHYSPRILTPSPPMAAAYLAARVHKIKIALLGPIVSHSNPVRLAEELAMLDTMADGRLVVGLLRGTTNEALTYDLNPKESRERTDEGMELILKAWTEPQPFGWQGRHFRYEPYRSGRARCNSRIRRPTLSAPAARPGSSPRATRSVSACRTGRSRSWGRQPAITAISARSMAGSRRGTDHLPCEYRAGGNRCGSATGDGGVSGAGGVRSGCRRRQCVAGTGHPQHRRRVPAASVNRALPINFVGGPDTVVEQIRRCREQTGAGIIDLGFNTPGSSDPDLLTGLAGAVRAQSSAAHPRHLREQRSWRSRKPGLS
jgi:alkanesulfonate monooxygenase SsuD/methylene tetrahydromethanopterin reductase-like flavin-dependent oxidoreductase (luciferase family)